jgi:predicted DNA binding protein
MWSLKIKVREKWNLYNSRTTKFKVKIYFYSHNFYEENGKYSFVASGLLEGDADDKDAFFKDLRKDKKISYFESNNDFFISIYSEPKSNERGKAVKVSYNPRLIFLKPTIIDEEGWEEWEVASPRKEDLTVFIDSAEKLQKIEALEFELLHLKQQKVENLMIYSLLPKLTSKQKEVFTLAVKNKYYGYPRRIKLEQLAKMLNISVSTCQFHLAKAEAKLMPFLSNKL